MKSSQRRCASSTRSSNGSFFAAAKNFAKDIDSIYSVEPRVQAEFIACANSSFNWQFENNLADNGAPNPRLTTGQTLPGEHTRLACPGRRPRRPHLCLFYTFCDMRGSSRRGRRLPHARARVLPGAENGRFRRAFGCPCAHPSFHHSP
jgi:hypothetical protein